MAKVHHVGKMIAKSAAAAKVAALQATAGPRHQRSAVKKATLLHEHDTEKVFGFVKTLDEDGKAVIRLIGDVTKGKRPLSDLYPKEPMARVALVRHRLPANIVSAFSSEMGVSKERVYQTFGLPRATAARKVGKSTPLSAEVSERAMCVAGLISQVEEMTAGVEDPGFNAPNWVAQWLDHPHPALGNQTPANLLDTADGRIIVSRLIAQIESGAYA